jgi:hypothetical protein
MNVNAEESRGMKATIIETMQSKEGKKRRKEVREANVYIDPNKSKEKIDTNQCISL